MSNLINKLSGYLGIDLRYAVSGGFWLTLGQIFSTAASFLLAIFFAKFLPKETYGVYSFALAAAGILAVANLPGMSAALTQAVARDYESSLLPALKTRIRWGLLGSLAGLAVAAYYYFSGNATLAFSFFIVAVFLPLTDSFNLYDAYLSGKKLFNFSAIYNIAGQIFSAGVLIAAVFLTKNIFWVLFAYFASLTLANFIFFKITVKKFKPNGREDAGTISYGKHLSAMNIISVVANYLDGILVFHYLGAASLATYAFAIAPPEQLKGLIKNVSALILPRFSQRTEKELKATMGNKVFKLSVVVALMVVAYILLAPFIYRMFFPKYLDAVFYSQVFSLSMLNTPAGFIILALTAHKKTIKLYWFNTVSPIFQILIMAVLTPLYGLFGLILARIIARTFTTVVSLVIYYKT